MNFLFVFSDGFLHYCIYNIITIIAMERVHSVQKVNEKGETMPLIQFQSEPASKILFNSLTREPVGW